MDNEIQSVPGKGRDGSRGRVETTRARQPFDAKLGIAAQMGKTTKTDRQGKLLAASA